MKRRFLALLLVACLCAACLPAGAEQDPAGRPLAEPVVEKDETLSTGQVTEWTCVTFGSYPQTEIVPEPSSAVDDYAVRDGDFLEDAGLYDALVRADWQENGTEIDGVRYLRMNREDAVSSASDRAGHYRWGEGDEWHYFRYDPIRWRVIALEDGKALLLSDRLLDCRPYHTEAGPITWEESSVRSWLNGLPAEQNAAGIDYRGGGFIDRAFSAEEREALVRTRVENRPNTRYGTDCGNDTEDYVFLLSNAEVFESDAAARYGFYASNGKDDPAKRFRSTMYAKCRGAWWSSVDGYMGNSFWFMRTNGYTRESVTYICDFGYIYQRGTISTCEDAGLLTAVWVDLDKAQLAPAGTVSSRDIREGASAVSAEGGNEKNQVRNPVVVDDPDQPDGKTVTYSLIRFGTYPQSAIVADASEASPDSIVDADLYALLEAAEWKDDRWEYQGTEYLRVPAADGEDALYFACEPLLWRALEVRDGTALLMSNAALECEPFQQDLTDVSWENCTLRSWLNGYGGEENASAIDYSGGQDNFMDLAFTADEQDAIVEYSVRNEDNYYFGMDSGDGTEDRIFILAESELFVYDSSEVHGFSPRDEVPDRARQFLPTDYAVWKGVWYDSDDDGFGNVFWITRTTGYTHANVVYVDESGYMYNRGILVTCTDAAVIPALVLDLDSSAYEYAGTYVIGAE